MSESKLPEALIVEENILKNAKAAWYREGFKKYGDQGGFNFIHGYIVAKQEHTALTSALEEEVGRLKEENAAQLRTDQKLIKGNCERAEKLQRALERILSNPTSDSTGSTNNANNWTAWAKSVAREALAHGAGVSGD